MSHHRGKGSGKRISAPQSRGALRESYNTSLGDCTQEGDGHQAGAHSANGLALPERRSCKNLPLVRRLQRIPQDRCRRERGVALGAAFQLASSSRPPLLDSDDPWTPLRGRSPKFSRPPGGFAMNPYFNSRKYLIVSPALFIASAIDGRARDPKPIAILAASD
jgi:hypothetical protein